MRAEDERAENVHFIAHHCVVRKDHDTTTVKIVFDGSAKSYPASLSLNDCLQKGDSDMSLIFDAFYSFSCTFHCNDC